MVQLVGQMVSSVACEARSFFAHLKPRGIGNPRRHPYQGRDRKRSATEPRNPEKGAAPYVVENRRR